jgi:hypothetical protein
MHLHAWFEAFVGGRWFTFDGAGVALTSNYGALELTNMKVTVEKTP